MSCNGSTLTALGLGTVQFGCDYGITNPSGQVSFQEVERILGRAATLGIKVLDTAALYGLSEETLGSILGPEHPFRIVTKTSKVASDIVSDSDAAELARTFDRSLTRLNQASIYGLLLHDANDLLKPGGARLLDALHGLKRDGRVTKIGVSVYTPKQIDNVLALFTPDLIQLPLNVLDQRLISGGHLKRLRRGGVEIHARSVFLQGLLLMKPQAVDSYFEPMRIRLESFHNDMTAMDTTPLQGALQFALSRVEVDTVLVGVCSRSELEEIRTAEIHPASADIDFSRWAFNDPRFIDPSKWRLHGGAADRRTA
ncbi:MAG: aldo/keto reductase [candidate division Zixibacteria bacterium]|nr:aldo/keto reductase [candidate division Zixibacteria bacterium]MDH3938051.1 aldo/keto reductase [candidate division Zixibacteria bacterium]MDH4033940.1 aldo/keto reductase [candidate division Zixibacteria bacterium]